jgi:drug/metabolite transporter (DMT)-like permease
MRPAEPAVPAVQAVQEAAAVPAGLAGAASPRELRTRQRQALLLLWLVPGLWAANHIVARLSDGVIGPHPLALGRWGLALLLMLPFVGATLWRERAALRRETGQLLVLGGLGMWVCGAFVYLGGHTTSAINIGLIYAVTPVGIAVVGVRLLGERMNPAQWVAVVLALAGVLVVVSRGSLGNLLAVRFTQGDAWIAVAAAAWIVYSVLLKRWPSVLGPAARLAAIMTGGLLVMLPPTMAELLWWPQPLQWPEALVLVAVAALLPGVLSYASYSYLQRELGASRTALILYLSPIYSALLAWWILGETPGWHHAVGAALILPSIWLATRPAAAAG